MKLAWLLLLSVCASSEAEPPSAEEQVAAINAVGSWTASLDWVNSRTKEDLERLLTTKAIKKKKIYEKNWGHLAERLKLPDRFDTRTAFPGCIGPVSSRHGCETAWEVGAIEVSTDRLCIYTSNNITEHFSLSYLQACNPMSKNCAGLGGDLPSTWLFIEEKGLPLETCVPPVPYAAGCPFVCHDLTPMKRFVFRDALAETSALSIRMALLNSGPVAGVIKVYEDFLYYRSGVYRHQSGKLLGETMLRIIGWDTVDGKSYWICANNWGPEWGDNGYIKIAFGQLGIEKEAMTIMPTLL